MSSPTRRALPNAITLGRLVLAVAFFIMLARLDRTADADEVAFKGFWAGICFAVAAATDLLDGYLARRWNVVTTFGRLMDPLVDKVLVLGGFVFLASAGFSGPAAEGTVGSGVTALMVVLILVREFLVTGIRSYAESQGMAFGADLGGKIKMVVQSFCVPWCVFVATRAAPSDFLVMTRDVTVNATLAITLLSGVSYLVRAFKLPILVDGGAHR